MKDGRAAQGFVHGESNGEARPAPDGTIMHLWAECPRASVLSYKIPISALSDSARKELRWCAWCQAKEAAGVSPAQVAEPALIAYEFLAGPMDGRQLMLSPLEEGFEFYIVRPPVEGPIIRDAQGRDNMRESSYKVTYEPRTHRALMIWQGDK